MEAQTDDHAGLRARGGGGGGGGGGNAGILSTFRASGVVLPTSLSLEGAEYLLVYLSASWCPPCRAYTPHLAAWVAEHGARHKARALFVSGDSDEGAATEYNKKMGFPMAAFSRPAFSALMAAWGLRGVPSLVVLRVADGAVVTKRAREKMLADPAGFPWPAAEGEVEAEEGGGALAACLRLLAVVALLAWGAHQLRQLGFFGN